MVATVYERENCASNPGHLGECRSLTFAPPKNTEKKKPRIERTTEILRIENVFEREKAHFYRLPGCYNNNLLFSMFLGLCGMIPSVFHHLGDWTRLKAPTALDVVFSGFIWTWIRNTSWRSTARKVSSSELSISITLTLYLTRMVIP